MKAMNDFEQAVLDKFLAGSHPTLGGLRLQAQRVRIVSRTFTEFGFLIDFEVPPGVPEILTSPPEFQIDDVYATVQELSWGVGFVLSVASGYLAMLEGYSVGEPWPRRIGTFQLFYEWEPRRLRLPEPKNHPPSSQPGGFDQGLDRTCGWAKIHGLST